MKKTLLVLTSLILMLGMAQAQKVKGNKKVTTETREVSDYHRIHVSGAFTVQLVEGTEGRIQLQGESNILPYVEVSVEGNTLFIKKKEKAKLRYKKPLIITVPVEEIGALSLHGSGDITTTAQLSTSIMEVELLGSGDITMDVASSRVLAKVKGSGDVNIQGTTIILSATLTGSGDLNAAALDSENTEVFLTGSGSAEVVAHGIFVGDLTGSGDITYLGNPDKETKRLTGSGEIKKGK